jgi:hypothetical protein
MDLIPENMDLIPERDTRTWTAYPNRRIAARRWRKGSVMEQRGAQEEEGEKLIQEKGEAGERKEGKMGEEGGEEGNMMRRERRVEAEERMTDEIDEQGMRMLSGVRTSNL